jgi:two-component system nitrate/nitrite response regulator NarL
MYDFTAARNGRKRARPEPGRAKALEADLPEAPNGIGSRIRILIADHHSVVRDGFQALLSTQPDFLVVGVSGDGAEALRLARQLTPDLLLLDSSIPGTTSLEVLKQLRADGLGTKAVMLAAAINRSEAVSLLRLGARGVVLKGASTELVYKCIRKVHDGELWFSRDIMGVVVESLSALDAERAPVQNLRLTPREHEVTRHIVGGDTNQAIARRLSVGEDTVKHHLTNIFNKTGVSSRLELALFALHHALVKPG